MSLQKIEAALIGGYIGAGLNLPTQWENVDFEKPAASPWAALYFLPSAPIVSSLGDDGFDEYDGFLQIDLNYPRNTSKKLSRDHYEILRQRFCAGKYYIYQGQHVSCTACEMSPAREVDGWYRVSISCYFRAYVTR